MASSRPFSCPVCDEEVPANAKSCPNCGACDKSGWNTEASEADGLGLPDEDFDYDKFTEEEFGQPRKRKGKELLVWITTVILILLFGASIFYTMIFRH